MAFFGLTSLGPPSAFQAAAIDYLDITLFTEAEFESAFKRVDKDGSGAITPNEVRASYVVGSVHSIILYLCYW